MKTQIFKEHYIPNIHAITIFPNADSMSMFTSRTQILINNLVELI